MESADDKSDILPGIRYFKDRGQEVMLVMYALAELGGENTKQEVIQKIKDMGWFNWRKEDNVSYESQTEPRFHTLFAWARKDGVERGWILNNQRDAWGLSRQQGREVFEKAKESFLSKKWDVRKCYLFKSKFKKALDPSYEPSDKDAKRPSPDGVPTCDELAQRF